MIIRVKTQGTETWTTEEVVSIEVWSAEDAVYGVLNVPPESPFTEKLENEILDIEFGASLDADSDVISVSGLVTDNVIGYSAGVYHDVPAKSYQFYAGSLNRID